MTIETFRDILVGPESSADRDRLRARSAGVTAMLGPTNTGKTHFAIERMVAHPSGIIGLPLRLLAREVYMRLIEKVGVNQVALITGEEKIKPKSPRFWVATVEAMPRDLDVSFVAIDEIQIAAQLDRGHVFTDRLLNRRGREETLLIGASTMEKAVRQLLPQATVVTRPRLSTLSFAGERKLSRLPRRSAIVAFSADDVYAIAELIRRQRGGAAVVMGALSPRTRNAQVELYQSGDVDYLVATDAIGMGLNLDLDHVAFAADRKFDGWQFRRLNPAEFGQIAGRAGRFMRDGTFGTSGRCPPFDEELIEAVEDHRFDSVGLLQWRNSDLDFSSIAALQVSLDRLPTEQGLTRAPLAEDVMVLDIAARDPSVVRQVNNRADVARLWEACQVPDYRKISPAAHAELVLSLFHFIVRAGRVPDGWFNSQLTQFDRVEGDLDVLSNRIAQVRTLSFIANRPDWLGDPEHWQGVTRQVEERLSDALHERLAQRFVDRRTSVLMRRLRENAMLEAEVTAQGDVLVEGEHVGQLQGFRFTADPKATGEAAKTLNMAALKAMAGEIESRANRFAESVDESVALANDGTIRWLGDPIAKIAAGDKLLAPRARILADEHLTGPALDTVQRRLDLWLAQHVKKLLGPLMELETGEGLEGIARGIAFQLAESLGVLERSRVAEEVKGLDQAGRSTLRKLGVRFGAYHLYLPLLLKPAPRALASQLWALRHGGVETVKGLDEVPYLAASGRTSFAADSAVPKGLYRAAGFRVSGARAVRVDILERLADLIRPAIAYRPGVTPGAPPPGTADSDGFVTTVSMTSLAGCSGEDFASILRSLGYVLDRRPGPAITVPLLPAARTEPIKPPGSVEGGSAEASDPEPASEAEAVPDELTAALRETPASEPDEATVSADAGEGLVEAPETDAVTELAASLPAGDEGFSSEPAEPLTEAPAEDGPEMGVATRDEVAPDSAELLAEVATEPLVEAPVDPTLPAAVEAEPAEAEVSDPTTTLAAPRPDPSEEAMRLPDPVLEQVKADDVSGEEPAAEQVEGLTTELPETGTEPDSPVDAESTAEASAGGEETSSVVTGESTEPAAPVLIEVWRPHRTNHHAQRRHDRNQPRPGRRGPPRAGAEAAVASGEVVAPETRPGDGQRFNRPHRPGQGDRRPHFGKGEGRPNNRQANAEAVPDQTGGRPPRQGKPPFDQRRDSHGRHDRPENGRGGNRPGGWSGGERPQRERQPDPNSPFAKLAALKADLEAKTKKD